jgi:hypothetical protein
MPRLFAQIEPAGKKPSSFGSVSGRELAAAELHLAR